jgi:hypothetical protein
MLLDQMAQFAVDEATRSRSFMFECCPGYRNTFNDGSERDAVGTAYLGLCRNHDNVFHGVPLCQMLDSTRITCPKRVKRP